MNKTIKIDNYIQDGSWWVTIKTLKRTALKRNVKKLGLNGNIKRTNSKRIYFIIDSDYSPY